jgi:hypothetical protein
MKIKSYVEEGIDHGLSWQQIPYIFLSSQCLFVLQIGNKMLKLLQKHLSKKHLMM